MKDLFENYSELPKHVQRIITQFEELDDDPYKACEKLLHDLKPHGLTFEYDLDGQSHSLQWITEIEVEDHLRSGEVPKLDAKDSIEFTIGMKKFRVKIDASDQSLSITKFDGEPMVIHPCASNKIEIH